MIISEQTVTDANTGVTLSFRPSLGRTIVNVRTRDGKSSDLMFYPDGTILAIVPNAYKELDVLEPALESPRVPPRTPSPRPPVCSPHRRAFFFQIFFLLLLVIPHSCFAKNSK